MGIAHRKEDGKHYLSNKAYLKLIYNVFILDVLNNKMRFLLCSISLAFFIVMLLIELARLHSILKRADIFYSKWTDWVNRKIGTVDEEVATTIEGRMKPNEIEHRCLYTHATFLNNTLLCHCILKREEYPNKCKDCPERVGYFDRRIKD